MDGYDLSKLPVAPHAGAWIETAILLLQHVIVEVAPHAGAWIETTHGACLPEIPSRRPPRGGVD